ncbi:hypothetical protein BsWGS_05672 [Bradybaena similaris]
MDVPGENGRTSATKIFTAMLKRLRGKVSSMHSPRIQCCCCAVGVFAAMFGIFMLSAGICIVLNVTFMEVDTSGLPPELHNEQGKKVVGVILICVALAFLGLSATVSILYFTLCSRKNQDSTKQQKTTSPVGVATGQERMRNRESVVAGIRRVASSNVNVVTVHSRAGMHLNAEFSKKKSYHVLRNRPALPPHQEEEADIAKSSTELNRVDEAFSTTTYHGKRLKQRDRREEPSKSLDVQVICSSSLRAPVIVVDTFHENQRLGTDEMETQLNDSDLGFDEDSVIQTVLYSERCTETVSGGAVFQIATNNSSVSSSSPPTLSHNDLSKSNLKPHPAFLHNVSIETELSSSSSTLVSSTCPSTPEPQQPILLVKPAKGASSGSVTYVPSSVDRVFEEDRDSLSHVTVISHHQDNHTVIHDENEGSFSRSHFNSAFSCDGNDPLQGDVE